MYRFSVMRIAETCELSRKLKGWQMVSHGESEGSIEWRHWVSNLSRAAFGGGGGEVVKLAIH